VKKLHISWNIIHD